MPQLLNISLEGNIASGKSTFLSALNRFSCVHPIAEGVITYQNCHGFNLLEALSSDDPTDLATFQIYALLTQMFEKQKSLFASPPFHVSDRSVETQKRVFWPFYLSQNKLQPRTVAILNSIYSGLKSLCLCEVSDVIVYLQSDPQLCFERCQLRGRKEESHYQLSDFEKIHALHERWLTLQEPPVHGKVYVIDTHGKSREEMEIEAKKLVDYLLKQKEYIELVQDSD